MELSLRRAAESDVPAVLRLFDDAIAWFVSIGNTGQWGTEPWSGQERRVTQMAEALALPGSWVAEHPELGVCGAIVTGEAMPYVPSADEPELYVRILIGSRDPRAKGVGRYLMAHAETLAHEAGVGMMRVDCYSGGTRDLVRFYESCGFRQLSAFDVDGWPGQLLGKSISAGLDVVAGGGAGSSEVS